MRPSVSSDRPIVTIGVLTCNAHRFVDRTIPALLSWSRPEHEILVLDNGSTDDTVERLQQFPELRLVCQRENVGYGGGKNALVAAARGRYVLLLDDDVLVADERAIVECLAFCQSHPDAAFVSVPLMDMGEDRTPHYGLFFTERKVSRSLRELQARAYFPVGGFVGGLMFCRKEVFEQLGGFETIYPCEDYDLCARAHLQGWRIYTITTAHAIHLGAGRRANSDRATAWDEYELCGFLRAILKNYTLPGVVVWVPLSSLWILWKTVRKYLHTGHASVLVAYGKSVARFFRDLRSTMQERARTQAGRRVRADVFRRVVFKPQTLHLI